MDNFYGLQGLAQQAGEKPVPCESFNSSVVTDELITLVWDETNMKADKVQLRNATGTDVAGTAEIVENSDIVTGTETAFTNDLNIGDIIIIDGGSPRRIIKIIDDEHLQVDQAYEGGADGLSIVQVPFDTTWSEPIDILKGIETYDFDVPQNHTDYIFQMRFSRHSKWSDWFASTLLIIVDVN